MKYDDNIGYETLYTEYKIFNFYNIGLELSNEDAISLIENKKWIFNNHIIRNIQSMIKIYLPKYTCAYLSNNLKKECSLYFGIDDFGSIIGIPFQGTLDKNIIQECLKETLLNNIQTKLNILDLITFDIIKLEYNNTDVNIKDIQPFYKEYIQIKKDYEDKKKKYIAKKNTWEILSLRYNQKLTDLVNMPDSRKELIQYIERKSFSNPAAKLLKSDIIISSCSTEDIIMFKNDYNSIYYWVTQWKDVMLGFIKSIKPKFNYRIPPHLYPTSILMAVKPMIPYWLNHNEDLNLYVIKFIFKPNNTGVKPKISYKNIYDEWTTCIRSVNEQGPCCLPICA